jgi:hypothetical protein
MIEDSPDHHLETHGVYLKGNKLYGRVDGKAVEIEDYVKGRPLYYPEEELFIKAHEIKCVKRDLYTSYGIGLMNAYFIEYPYEGLVEFVNSTEGKPIKANQMNDIALHQFLHGPGTVQERVARHKRFENDVGPITCLAECAITPASEKTVTANPENAKRKKELLELHKNNLSDPAVLANIQKELEDLDRKYLEGDEAEYYLSSKKARASRTRVYNIHGGETDFFNPGKMILVENSLHEGYQLKDVPVMANQIREGSYHRAISTANGGAEVKKTGRIFQNYTIVHQPCTTKNTIRRAINVDNYKQYAGRYRLNSTKPLTESELKSSIGKVTRIMSPQWCTSPGNTVCSHCMGDKVTNTNIGLAGLTNSLTSNLMSIDMAAMHTAGLSTARYNYIDRIS